MAKLHKIYLGVREKATRQGTNFRQYSKELLKPKLRILSLLMLLV